MKSGHLLLQRHTATVSPALSESQRFTQSWTHCYSMSLQQQVPFCRLSHICGNRDILNKSKHTVHILHFTYILHIPMGFFIYAMSDAKTGIYLWYSFQVDSKLYIPISLYLTCTDILCNIPICYVTYRYVTVCLCNNKCLFSTSVDTPNLMHIYRF